MGAHYIQMGLLKILPDTPICNTAVDNGYLSCEEPPYSVLANHWLAHEELAELYWLCECVEKFHNNRYFFTFWRYLRERRQDIAGFFEDLLEVSRRHGFFQLAATQEFMSRLLCECVAGRPDAALIRDILRYDWLRCGHRFLPKELALAEGAEVPGEIRDRLYRTMPEELEGVYRRGEKNHFFRKVFCFSPSVELFPVIGLGGLPAGTALCFAAEREDSLFRFTRVIPL
jgi:hypothetical protein